MVRVFAMAKNSKEYNEIVDQLHDDYKYGECEILYSSTPLIYPVELLEFKYVVFDTEDFIWIVDSGAEADDKDYLFRSKK